MLFRSVPLACGHALRPLPFPKAQLDVLMPIVDQRPAQQYSRLRDNGRPGWRESAGTGIFSWVFVESSGWIVEGSIAECLVDGGFLACRRAEESCIGERWAIHRSRASAWPTPIPSPVSGPTTSCETSSAIRKCGCSLSSGAQKNALRQLRTGPLELV